MLAGLYMSFDLCNFNLWGRPKNSLVFEFYIIEKNKVYKKSHVNLLNLEGKNQSKVNNKGD